jgi:hypothetical protein
MHRIAKNTAGIVGIVIAASLLWDANAQSTAGRPEKTGKQLYESACSACHGTNGKGTPVTTVGFTTALPDFTNCSFASREPDEDWLAIIHEGGPIRSFDRMMPAFRDALSNSEMRRILDYVRTFCADDSWPRGELNLPRPLVTEKAYPEDEAVLTVNGSVEGPAELNHKFVYERRIGARNQVEIAVPFSFLEQTSGQRVGGIGDIALGFKRDLFHSFNKGSIFSAAGEIILPTGDKNKGLGSGTTIFEPFVAFGQLLPSSSFLQFQGGLELPADRTRPDEAFWRTVVGKSYLRGGYGRSWSPMVELVGARELVASERTHWDLVPQIQVSLSKRQHVLLSAGVRIPLNDAHLRTTQIMLYVLWDWFDGGLFSGW